MHTPRLLAALALALVARGASASPVTAVIWRGGSKTAEEAAGAMKEWERVREDVSRVVELPRGYPQIVRSETVPGLRAGFHAVLLGYCAEPEGARVLSLLRVLDPEIYGRPVEGPADACPRADPALTVAGPLKVKAGAANTLTVAALSGPNDGSVGLAVALLRDAQGKVLERRTFADVCWGLEVTRLDKARLRVSGTCYGERCTVPEILERSWTLEAEEAIATRERNGRQLQKMSCDE